VPIEREQRRAEHYGVIPVELMTEHGHELLLGATDLAAES
jgi:hypothetical protein